MKPTFIFGKRSPLGAAICVGSFDGVHKGHQAVLDTVKRCAKEQGLQSLVASFNPHPRVVLAQAEEMLLSPGPEKALLLRQNGVQAYVELPFTKMASFQEPEDFVTDVLVSQLGAKVVVVGHDHRFGHKRRGDVDLLDRMGLKHGFQTVQCNASKFQGSVISS